MALILNQSSIKIYLIIQLVTVWTVIYCKILPSFCKAISDELTAKDNSMGSSGGTTEVNISVHSKKSL